MAINIINSWNKVVRLDWTHDPDMSTYYIVKKDGVRIGKTTANRYYAHYLDEGTSYNFEVVKVNSMEVESSVGTNTATTTTGVDYVGAEPRIIDARTVSPGYSSTDATNCYINAINSANEGDIVNFAPGLSGDGKWRIGDTLGNHFQGGITSSYITINIEDNTEFNAINGTWTSNLSMFMRFDCLRGIRVIGYNALVYLRSSNFTGGDARMSIAFYNSAEWTVEGIELDGSGGDAIFWGDKYLGIEANVCAGFNVANERTLVYNVKALNHRRVGFGPTSMDGGQINHTHADLTGAVYEQANLFGYSFENDYPGQSLSNIHLRYGYSTAALYSGIGFNITKATAATPFLSASFYDFVTDNNWLEDPNTDVGNYGHRRDFHSSYGGGQGTIKFERTAFMNPRHAGFGATTRDDRISFDLDDFTIVNALNANAIDESDYYTINFNRLTIGNGIDMGNFDINGLFITQPTNQAWLSLRGSSADTYNLEDVNVSNAMIVTPYTGAYHNPQNKPEGLNFNLSFTQQTTAPAVTVNVSSTANAERGGNYGNITVTRNIAANYPTPVQLVFSGTAIAFDDYDFIPPVMVIPAGATSLTWPIKARAQNKANSTLTVGVANSDYYSVGINSVSLSIQDIPPTVPNVNLTTLKAFPTAKGFGQIATGGRGGRVIHVTNNNDSGIGSLRAALLETGPRTIVFDVGGDIDINTRHLNLYNLNQGDLTIAGQTAPSNLTIRTDNVLTGPSTFGAAIDISANNIIMRYLTIRETNPSTASGDRDLDAIRIRYDAARSDRYIFDHMSMSHAKDEIFNFRDVANLTLQNSLLSYATGSGAILFGGTNTPSDNISIVDNALLENYYRNPLVGAGGERFELINNIIFGFQVGGTDVVYGSEADLISNVYKQWNDRFGVNAFAWDLHGYTPGNGFPVVTPDQGGFYIDQLILANPSQFSNTPSGIRPQDVEYNTGSRLITNSLITEWDTTQEDIDNRLLPHVGNSLYRDTEDTTVINRYINGSNNPNSLTVVDKAPTSRPNDYYVSNLDIPEAFVQAHGITSNNQVITNWDFGTYGVTNTAGYSALEIYLAYMAGDLDRLANTESSTPTVPPVEVPDVTFSKYRQNSNNLFLNS